LKQSPGRLGATKSTVKCTGTFPDGVTNLNGSNGPIGSASVPASAVHPGT